MGKMANSTKNVYFVICISFNIQESKKEENPTHLIEFSFKVLWLAKFWKSVEKFWNYDLSEIKIKCVTSLVGKHWLFSILFEAVP